MMCSILCEACTTVFGSSASPTTTWAPRTLNAAAFIGSRTRTRSWWPTSRILCATPRPTKPVEPRRRILATAENRSRGILTPSGRRYVERLRPRDFRLPARRRRHLRRDSPTPRARSLPRDLRRQRWGLLHGRPDGLRRGPAAGWAGLDGPGARFQTLIG